MLFGGSFRLPPRLLSQEKKKMTRGYATPFSFLSVVDGIGFFLGRLRRFRLPLHEIPTRPARGGDHLGAAAIRSGSP